MISREEVIEIGILRKPHGTRGEIACTWTLSQDIDTELEYLILEVDSILVPFFLEDMRWKNNETVLFTFEDITTENQVSRLAGCRVYLHQSQAPELEKNLAQSDLVGWQVVDAEKGILGTIRDIDTSTINTLFALDNETIIPIHEDFIIDINPDKQTLTLSLPEGLLNL